MPHQCVRCNTFYDDGAKEIMKGCKCGGRLFFYIRKERLEQIQKATTKLSRDDKDQIEHDVLDMVGSRRNAEPVVLDLEAIRINKPGQYEIDLVNLFKKEPLIYRLEEGKYVIDLPETFRNEAGKGKKRK